MSNLYNVRLIEFLGLAAISVHFTVLFPVKGVVLVHNSDKIVDRAAFIAKLGGAAAWVRCPINDGNCPDA